MDFDLGPSLLDSVQMSDFLALSAVEMLLDTLDICTYFHPHAIECVLLDHCFARRLYHSNYICKLKVESARYFNIFYKYKSYDCSTYDATATYEINPIQKG